MHESKLRFKADDGSKFPDWEEKRFGETVLIERGGSPRPIEQYLTDDEDGYNWIKIGDAPEYGNRITSTAQKIIPDGLKKTRRVYIGDLILSNSMSFGKPYILGIEGCIHDGWLLIRDEKNNYNKLYLCYILGSEYMLRQYKKLAAGTGVNNLNKELVSNTKIMVPCLAEQQKIADFLSTMDTVIEKQKATVEAWEERKKGMMQKLFSQEVRFKADDGSEFPDWEEKKLGEITSIHARIGWQNLRKDEFLIEGTYLLITGTDFCDGHVNYSTCYYVNKERYEQDANIQVKNGTILVTKDGTLGKVALIKKLDMPATLNAGVFAINVLDATMSEEYLYHYLAAPMLLTYAKKHSTGGTIKHLNQGIIVDFPVACPCLAEQQKIADCLSALDDVIEKQKATLAAWKEMKKGLLQQMFV